MRTSNIGARRFAEWGQSINSLFRPAGDFEERVWAEASVRDCCFSPLSGWEVSHWEIVRGWCLQWKISFRTLSGTCHGPAVQIRRASTWQISFRPHSRPALWVNTGNRDKRMKWAAQRVFILLRHALHSLSFISNYQNFASPSDLSQSPYWQWMTNTAVYMI